MDRYQALQSFVAVVDAGSFVAGAEALGISKAAISRHVGELESHLGVRLLNRTTRRLSLTVEGEIYLARARELLAGFDAAQAEISSRSGEAVGPLKVNVPVSFGLLHLAPLWAGFLVQHPKVVLDVTLSDRVVDLVDEGYDLAVRIARLPTSSLVSRKLTSTRLVLCATPEYLRRHGSPAHPSELAGHAVMAYSLLSIGENWAFDGPDGPVTVKITPRMRTNSGDSCRSVALAHGGIVLQPTFLVGDALRSGELVEVLPAFRSIELDVYAVYPSRKHLTPKVRLLVDHLVEAFRVRGWPA
ncbi:DNA-binding transcriptional LysR family regulator [Sphaerotilus hippei]|uniref:DNA-binding transcriptional LysR family regulator n=1 Tax=Sphaerotilus hippei TaxID=744406 RepID=A0A318H5Y8_9BURK|nr:LysR family transcriptional regulator [Sphaerotilus hippei]PXW99360.1 DNA-binding transcriptional LysR family regulator [Sphaerotilus hippei]